MSDAAVLFAVEDGVATVTLHRPEKLNAYTSAMGEEVCAAFDTGPRHKRTRSADP